MNLDSLLFKLPSFIHVSPNQQRYQLRKLERKRYLTAIEITITLIALGLRTGMLLKYDYRYMVV